MMRVMLSNSLIFLVIVVIRKVFRGKVGNVFLYALWLLFAAGLLLSSVSFGLWNVTGWDKGSVKSPASIMNFVKMPVADTGKEDAPAGQTEHRTVNQQHGQETGLTDKEGTYAKKPAKDRTEMTSEGWIKPRLFRKVLCIIWAVGAAVVLLRQFAFETMMRRQLTENREQMICQGQKVYKTKGIQTPLLFRGRGLALDIYLPEAVLANEALARHAILHENIHKRHGDIWWGYLRNLLVAVYWFYPFAWIAAMLSKRDCEYACDSAVMEGMCREERIAYGNSLLSLIQVGSSFHRKDLFCTATAMKMRKSEMEVRIRMIARGEKRNKSAAFFAVALLCAVGVAAFTDAAEPQEEAAKVKQAAQKQPEQKKSQSLSAKEAEQEQKESQSLSAKEAEYEITDLWGADKPQIYYEDESKMIFAGYFGLFVYSHKKEEIVQSLDLKEIGCHMTQGDRVCEISVSEDGGIVYLHVKNDPKMYAYSVADKELQYLDYDLPQRLYNRQQEEINQSGIRCNGDTIGDLVYYWCNDGDVTFQYKPLFYRPYGSCGFFKPEDIRDLSEVSFYANGTEYVITEAEKLQWIKAHFSEPAEEIEGVPACPFYHVMYLKRKDGTCGKLFPATDSCCVYQTEQSYYEYDKSGNESLWKLFGITDIN